MSTFTKNNRKNPALLDRLDWSAGHTPLTGTVNSVSGALAAASLGHSTGMPAGWALAAGAAGAMATAYASARRRLTTATLTFRTACWLTAGGWTSWAIANGGPWHWPQVGTLAVAGIAGGCLAPVLAGHEEIEQEARRHLLLIGARRQMAADWTDRIQRVCNVQVTVLGIEHWPSGAGYTLEVELPEGGTTRRAITDRSEGLGADLDLPEGCGLQVMPGISRRRVLILVTTQSLAGIEIPFPVAELSELATVNNPLPIAVLSDGARAELDLRQASTIVTGPTGSGKTNWLHTLIAELNGTNDTLVWVIDLNAGSIGLPWLNAWHDAQTGRDGARWTKEQVPVPGVDWVASTPGEAKRMLAAAVRIAKRRKVAYQDAMRDANDDKLPVGPSVPEIVIIMDEGAEVAATREARAVLAGVSEVIRIARAMAIRAVVSVLRVTSDVMPDPLVRKMASNRVATGAYEDSELGHLFGWRALRAEDSFSGPGSLLVGTEGKQPAKARQWRITPAQIEEISAVTAHRRPALDGPSLEAAGEDYTERWTLPRCGHLWNTAETAEQTTVAASGAAAGQAGAGPLPAQWKATANWDRPAPGSDDELESIWLLPPAEEPSAATATDWSDPSTWTSGRDEPASVEEPGAKDAALALLLAAGPDGTGASAMERALKDSFGTRRPVIQNWLKAWAESGDVVRVGEGSKVRYVHRLHADGA
ncbi:hypothetical protein F4556_003405 [Kitasatospora gansuensis]|uniref:FtsK domain-containing protein n=1 Tax=Kitasatospora gansuensis TaxID=258050 RepID=A0A7W7SCC1_9ACTN|nr:hypothetical protein [Kitasatospora gansuensis]MBB4947870.1 hypothetical protein [Kitasatospora gansuensis]